MGSFELVKSFCLSSLHPAGEWGACWGLPPPPSSYVKALTSRTVLEMGPSRKWFLLCDILKLEPWSDSTGTLIRRGRDTRAFSLPLWGHNEKVAAYEPEKEVSPEPDPLDLPLGLLSRQNCEKQILLGKPPSHGVLLWKPEHPSIELFLHSTFPMFNRREECYR